MTKIKQMKLRYVLIIFPILLAACTGNPTGSATPTLTTSPGVTASAASPTPLPDTPTPLPGKVLFVAAETGTTQAAAIHSLVAQLASADKMAFGDLTTLSAGDLGADVRIVVLLSAPENLAALLSAAPGVQFVAIGPPADLDSRPNLTVIQRRPEQVAFLAGFIATIISSDWRSAALLPDTPAGLAEAFQNGGRYYCGRCTSLHGPVTAFPLVTVLPAGSAFSAWQDGLAQMQTRLLQTLYVDPSISSPDLLNLLSGQNLVLVGGLSPAEDLRARWAATVSADLAGPLQTLWPRLAAGEGGETVSAALQLSDVNENLLSPGRQRLVQDVITGLQDGSIVPLSPPSQ